MVTLSRKNTHSITPESAWTSQQEAFALTWKTWAPLPGERILHRVTKSWGKKKESLYFWQILTCGHTWQIFDKTFCCFLTTTSQSWVQLRNVQRSFPRQAWVWHLFIQHSLSDFFCFPTMRQYGQICMTDDQKQYTCLSIGLLTTSHYFSCFPCQMAVLDSVRNEG